MRFFHFFTKEKNIENVVKLLRCGIFEFFLQTFWMFNNHSIVRFRGLEGICDILETLKVENFKNDTAFLLNKMSEFDCERLFDDIMKGDHYVEYTSDLIQKICRNFQNK